MPPEDKRDLSIVTCNIISETKNIDVASKIKEINLARKQMGEDLFLGSAKEIDTSFKYDLCVELVLNDDEYELKLQKAVEIEKEEERLARIQREEEERLARIQREEEERLARIQREEEERLARIQREEEERQIAENMAAYSSAVNNILKNYQPEPTLDSVSMGYRSYEYDFDIRIDCKNMKGLQFHLMVTFKDNIGKLKSKLERCGYWSSHTIDMSPQYVPFATDISWTDRIADIAKYESENDPMEFIDTITLRLVNVINRFDFAHNLSDGPEKKEIMRLINPATYNLNSLNSPRIEFVDIKQDYTLYDSQKK